MNVTIRYRLDNEEVYTTDCNTLYNTSWDEVFEEVKSIEAHHTVLEIKLIEVVP